MPASPAVTLHTPLLERVLDWAYRWRTALGLGLAAITTAAVLVVYQLPGSNEIAADNSTGAGAESRSAIAAVTDFAGRPEAEETSTTAGEREVNSAVDDGRGGAEPAAPAITTSTSIAPTTERESTTIEESTTSSEVEDSTTTETTVPTSETTETTLDPSSTTSPDESTTTTDPTAPTSSPDPTSTSTSAPTTSSTSEVPIPVRAEAEGGTLLGTARARADHDGFSGSGFVGDLINEGSGVSITVDAVGGQTPFKIRYSASSENGPQGRRTISVLVNGVRVTEASMRLTPSWNDWDFVSGTLDLAPGQNEITLVWQAGDTGWVNIDYVETN